MGEGDFHIDILRQGWLGDEPNAAAVDLCSHGRMRIVIGGQVVTDGSEDYGVSETALALLRTLERDHSRGQPVAERLVFHGCGTMLMMGCPIGIDWSVQHLPGERVRISEVRRFDTTNDAKAVTFPELTVDLHESEYRRAVTRFATEAKRLFAGVSKSIEDKWDRQQYDQFWQEYDGLLERFG